MTLRPSRMCMSLFQNRFGEIYNYCARDYYGLWCFGKTRQFTVKSVLMNVSCKHADFHLKIYELIDWSFYQLFGLSFWRHPFTAEDPLVSKRCTIMAKNIGTLGKYEKWGETSLWNKCFSQIHIGHNYWHPKKFLWVKYLYIFPFIFTILSTPGWLWTWNYPAMASCFTEI